MPNSPTLSAMANVMTSPSSVHHGHDDDDCKDGIAASASTAVKLELLDENFFGGYGWDDHGLTPVSQASTSPSLQFMDGVMLGSSSVPQRPLIKVPSLVHHVANSSSGLPEHKKFAFATSASASSTTASLCSPPAATSATSAGLRIVIPSHPDTTTLTSPPSAGSSIASSTGVGGGGSSAGATAKKTVFTAKGEFESALEEEAREMQRNRSVITGICMIMTRVHLFAGKPLCLPTWCNYSER
jgi:hypothetical protein